jgi:hypothetical protein
MIPRAWQVTGDRLQVAEGLRGMGQADPLGGFGESADHPHRLPASCRGRLAAFGPATVGQLGD